MDKVAISTGGSMLVVASLIYIGGFTCLYIHLLCRALCPTGPSSRGSENDNQVSVSHNLDGRADWEEYSYVVNIRDDSDSDNSTESSDRELYGPCWLGSTRDIETFWKSSNLQQSEFPVTTQPGAPLRSKSLKFNPISREHSTFSGDEYKRRNREYFATLKTLKNNPDLLEEVYSELRDFKNNEMEVLQQMPQNSDSEQNQTDTGLIFEMDC